MNKNITAIGILLLILIPEASKGADPYQPFIKDQYPSKDFAVSQKEFHNGEVLIKIIEAKKISRTHNEPPHFCRTWLSVIKSKNIYKKYYDDIEPVGFSYGLFIPKVQPPLPYFAVVKNGDYDGRLFLIRKDGKVFDLMGGFYFITKNKRYVFSEYASDSSGLAVFDLRAGRVVFSTEKIPAEMYQWYEKNGTYFFTASEWNDEDNSYYDHFAYFYDFKKNKIIEKVITKAEITASLPVKFDFDPREYEDCTTTQNKSLHTDAE